MRFHQVDKRLPEIILHLQLVGLGEQRADVNAGGIVSLERLQHMGHRDARVHDILHDHHVTACDIDVQTYQLTHRAGGVNALIGRHLHETDFTRDVHLADEVGRKHETAVQHTQEKGILSLVVTGDFRCHTLHFFAEFLRRNKRYKPSVLN